MGMLLFIVPLVGCKSELPKQCLPVPSSYYGKVWALIPDSIKKCNDSIFKITQDTNKIQCLSMNPLLQEVELRSLWDCSKKKQLADRYLDYHALYGSDTTHYIIHCYEDIMNPKKLQEFIDLIYHYKLEKEMQRIFNDYYNVSTSKYRINKMDELKRFGFDNSIILQNATDIRDCRLWYQKRSFFFPRFFNPDAPYPKEYCYYYHVFILHNQKTQRFYPTTMTTPCLFLIGVEEYRKNTMEDTLHKYFTRERPQRKF
jgi:hypothetical protein